jgi:hypothetical protein
MSGMVRIGADTSLFLSSWETLLALLSPLELLVLLEELSHRARNARKTFNKLPEISS